MSCVVSNKNNDVILEKTHATKITYDGMIHEETKKRAKQPLKLNLNRLVNRKLTIPI